MYNRPVTMTVDWQPTVEITVDVRQTSRNNSRLTDYHWKWQKRQKYVYNSQILSTKMHCVTVVETIQIIMITMQKMTIMTEWQQWPTLILTTETTKDYNNEYIYWVVVTPVLNNTNNNSPSRENNAGASAASFGKMWQHCHWLNMRPCGENDTSRRNGAT